MIRSVEEISDVIKEVLEKIDEPDIKNRNIEFKVLDDRQFEKHLKQSRITEEAKYTNGTTTRNPSGKYLVTLREANFHPFFKSYFHELGHVANYNLLSNKNMPPEKIAVFSDALAFSLEHYAKEKFNELRYAVTFIDVLAHYLRKQYLKKAIGLGSDQRNRSLMVLYVLLDSNCKTYEDTYKTLKGLIKSVK